MYDRVRQQREWTGGGTVGTVWQRSARRVAQGEWGRKAVWHKGVPRRGPADRGGLGVRAQPSRGAAMCDASARSGAPWCPKPFELAHFDQVLLKILQLKCHKQSILKL
jgi:hypothetical protein